MDQGDGHGRAAPERAAGQGSRRADRGGRTGAALAHAPRGARARFMSSVDVPVALLGYGTVGAAVNRLLVESADDIERATGHRLRVVRALVRNTDKQRSFEPSVCAAIPVIKVLRESLVVTNVHRVTGIVNGTTNFMLTRMEAGASYEDALAEAQRLG